MQTYITTENCVLILNLNILLYTIYRVLQKVCWAGYIRVFSDFTDNFEQKLMNSILTASRHFVLFQNNTISVMFFKICS